MPGIVVFRRRWSIGSDDLVVPMIFMIILHSTWLIALAIVRGVVHFDPPDGCTTDLRNLILGHIVILSVCIALETVMAFVSTRGSILTQAPRASMEYLLYGRIVVGLVELAWLIMGAVWSSRHYPTCTPDSAKEALLGVMVFNWLMILLFFISLWCVFDSAGRKWVKMKKYQDSLKERRQERRRGTNRRQSGSRRNWRQRSKIMREFFYRRMQRKAFRAYEESWDRRLQLLCCCVERKGHNRNSMSEIAALFTDFFRDLDVVPSDIIAGLVLLRKHQQLRMNSIISQGSNDVYQYLSGVPITPQTKFLQLSQPDVLENFQKVIHYMRFALAVYGWPVYVMMHPGTWLCRLLPLLRCCCCKKQHNVEIVDDNCCLCNFSTAGHTSGLHNLDLVYCTYHVDIGETPFFVALDHVYKKVVVAVRGTLSLQDVLTDLKAEPETLPLHPPRDDWQGHKGMIQAAVYIKKKLVNDGILQMAWERDEERETAKYDLVLVGHSLGAGTAAILAILLKADYPNLHCYAYSPPGGLLTLPCVEETKPFITSVVVGKDCVPRIGLPQLEMLRADILNHIKNTNDAKWKIISKGLLCCSRYSDTVLVEDLLQRDVTAHPSNSAIGLSAHMPLYPPGQMIHVVRSHLKDKRTKGFCGSTEPIFQAIWANNGDFDEVLVSPTMINDHMPDNVLEALEKVVMKVAPEKPVHTLTEEQRKEMLSHPSTSSLATPTASEVNNSSERTQNARGSDDSNSNVNGSNFGANVDNLFEEDDTAVLFGVAPEMEELVQAPLASPETLSMASGVAVFSPSSSIVGRDSLRQSLQRCAVKQMDSPCENPNEEMEVIVETANQGKRSRSASQKSGSSSPKDKSSWREKSASPANQDVEAGDGGDAQGSEDYVVKLRSGNMISVKAEVVNEMVKQNTKASSPPPEGQKPSAENDVTAYIDSGNHDSNSAVLEPSSHTHVVSPSHQKQFNTDQENSSALPYQSDSTESGNYPTFEISKPEHPSHIGLIVGWGSGGSQDEGEERKNLLEDYTRHSPLESNQHEYAHPNMYYSQAGIGYPNNAFYPPLRFHSFPGEGNPDDICDVDGNGNDDGKPLIVRGQSDEEKVSKDYANEKIGPRKPFTHAESESNLLSNKRFMPRMKRSAEQGDIAHLCDALEVFEIEEDKSKLCYSSMVLKEEEPEDIVKSKKTDSSHNNLNTSSHPSGKKSSAKHSVSFGESTLIPSPNSELNETNIVPNEHRDKTPPRRETNDRPSQSNHKSALVNNQSEGSSPLTNATNEVLDNQATTDRLTNMFLDQRNPMLQETHL